MIAFFHTSVDRRRYGINLDHKSDICFEHQITNIQYDTLLLKRLLEKISNPTEQQSSIVSYLISPLYFVYLVSRDSGSGVGAPLPNETKENEACK